MIPFAPFAPDLASTDTTVATVATNVIPALRSYRPLAALSAYSDALSGDCRGYFMARKENGDFEVFAFTKTGAYKLNSSLGWEDVTNTGGAYTGPPDGSNWSIVQFGNNVVAVNINDSPQVFNVESDSDFSDLGGSPPNAYHVWSASGYLVLGNIASEPQRVRWSALEDITSWTVGEQGADFQDFPSGGPVLGGVGYETGSIVFSKDSVRYMNHLPGSEWTFAFQEREPAGRGLAAPQSLIQNGNKVAFMDEDGFYELAGGQLTPIGGEQVDRTILETIDNDRLPDVQGVMDPVNKLYAWAVPTNSAPDGTFDQIWIYNWQLKRWAFWDVTVQCLLTAATPGYTLEGLDALGYTLETLPFSLDSRVWKGGRPVMAAIDSDKKLAFFSGSNAEATIETADIMLGGEGNRASVNRFRPVVDASTFYGRVGVKDTFGDDLTWGTENSNESDGSIPVLIDGRTARFRVRIPAGEEWSHAVGIAAVEIVQTGPF